MGHIRLGSVPKSRPWQAVVEAVLQQDSALAPMAVSPRMGIELSPSDVAGVAMRTLVAADGGFRRAADDAGLRYTFFLLTQIALASREETWLKRLSELGISLNQSGTVFDLAASFQAAIDDYLIESGRSSDFSEVAQRAAGESLCDLTSDQASTLFGNTGDEVRQAVRSYSTKTGFGVLGQRFFGRFLTYFLNFYLSRVTAANIGSGLVTTLGTISALDRTLARHCEQSAAILRDFAGEWYSKTTYQPGINLVNAGGFVAVAIRKLQDELRAQRSGA